MYKIYSYLQVINLLENIKFDMRCDRNSILYCDSIYSAYESAIDIVDSYQKKFEEVYRDKYIEYLRLTNQG